MNGVFGRLSVNSAVGVDRSPAGREREVMRMNPTAVFDGTIWLSLCMGMLLAPSLRAAPEAAALPGHQMPRVMLLVDEKSTGSVTASEVESINSDGESASIAIRGRPLPSVRISALHGVARLTLVWSSVHSDARLQLHVFLSGCDGHGSFADRRVGPAGGSVRRCGVVRRTG